MFCLEYLKAIISSKIWKYSVATLVIINSIILGMETYNNLMNSYGSILIKIDETILSLFVGELALRLIVYRTQFFKDPWSIFDFCVIIAALIPSQGALSVLRSVRALRALRLVSIFPKLKGVIEGLIQAIPGICSIAAVMAIIICVFALMASKLYGANYPQWFGNFHISIFSLFQIMTLEGWPDIVRTVMKDNDFAWIFFITYILIATYSVLNLFIAVIVEAMQRNNEEEEEDHKAKLKSINQKLDFILEKLSSNHSK